MSHKEDEMAFLASQLEDLGEGGGPQWGEDPQGWVDETAQALELMSATEHELAALFESVSDGEPIQPAKLDLTVNRMSESLAADPNALLGLSMLRQYDQEGFDHSINVSIYLMTLGRALGLDDESINGLGLAGLLHDIGKAKLPQSLIQKRMPLTPEERQVIDSHVSHTIKMLQDMDHLHPAALRVAMEHHERLDGSGYPRGLKEGQISLEGRMGAVCDCFDAMTSNRSYRKKLEGKTVLKDLMERARSLQLDGKVVESFVRAVGIYPLGTIVRLADTRVGVVIRSNASSLLHPTLRIVAKGGENSAVDPYLLDLARNSDAASQRIVGTESPSMTRINPTVFMPGSDLYAL
ncbi:HD-GYP domain-containing protein [Magnetococcus sp. PR-3]|uniref:HD-GYP domain-containing protein n=1 Tax=Magnetococcus sp. PR-3 TaxID=3120355 RepID=UPI002FCE04E4